MTRPARQNHQAVVYALQRRQIWAVLILVLVGVLIEKIGVGNAAKSIAVGSLLAYFAQSAFTILAYRITKVVAGRMIMLNMYLGQLTKWLITLAGFALIFMALQPINPLWVLIGYFVMQIVHTAVMWRLHKSG